MVTDISIQKHFAIREVLQSKEKVPVELVFICRFSKAPVNVPRSFSLDFSNNVSICLRIDSGSKPWLEGEANCAVNRIHATVSSVNRGSL